MIKSQILQLGILTIELSDKVELVTEKKVPEIILKRQDRQVKSRQEKTLRGQKILQVKNISVTSVIANLRRYYH